MGEQLSVYETVEEARAWVKTRLEDGCDCPVCGQHAQAYQRAISAGMIGTMARVYAAQHDLAKSLDQGAWHRQWVHLADIPQRSRDTASLAYWGLIEQRRGKRGEWRVTSEGASFLRGSFRVSKYAHVFNNTVIGYSGPSVSVYEVDKRFDFDALMRGETK